jgi:hypothetical protein
MKIQKFNFTGRPLFKEETSPIKYWVDIQSDHIEIRISSKKMVETVDIETGEKTSQEQDVYKFWDIINLSTLQQRPGFADQTSWSRLNSAVQGPQITDEGVPYANTVNNSLLVDVFSRGLITKPGEFNNPYTDYSDALWTIFVPDSSSNCTTFTVRLVVDPTYEGGYIFEGPSGTIVPEDGQTIIDQLSPITLSSVTPTVNAESSVVINVTSDTFIDEIWLEQVYGSLNKTRVKLTNGQGTFTAFSTGLEAGEVIRVKAGHRKFTGLADIIVPVV